MQDDSVGRDCREIEVRLMKIWHRMWGKYRRGCAKIVPSLWLPIAFFFLRRQWSDVSDNYNDADKKPSRYGTKVGAVPVEAIKASKACWIFGLGSQNEKVSMCLRSDGDGDESEWRKREFPPVFRTLKKRHYTAAGPIIAILVLQVTLIPLVCT